MAVNDVGIDRVRLEVTSGAENPPGHWVRMVDPRGGRYSTVNDNDDPYTINWKGFDFGRLDAKVEEMVIPLQRRLEARGEQLFVNLCYVAFTHQIRFGKYTQGDPEEYAEDDARRPICISSRNMGWSLTPWRCFLSPTIISRSGIRASWARRSSPRSDGFAKMASRRFHRAIDNGHGRCGSVDRSDRKGRGGDEGHRRVLLSPL